MSTEKILIIDTSTKNLYAIVVCDHKILGKSVMFNSLKHSEKMIDAINCALKEANLTLSDIDVYAFSVGPGSFTGVRVGVATVKAYRLATNKKCVSVNTLQVFAYNNTNKNVEVIMDAGRELYYYGKFDGLNTIVEPTLIDIVEKEKLNGQAILFDENVDLTNALTQLISDKVDKRMFTEDFDIVYLRKPQAQEDYERKNGSC